MTPLAVTMARTMMMYQASSGSLFRISPRLAGVQFTLNLPRRSPGLAGVQDALSLMSCRQSLVLRVL
jgi:hypothetical protein